MITSAFHIHTHHSYDSFTRPQWLVDRAIRLGIDSLAVTDHDTLAGALETKRCATKTKLNVIVGVEYATDLGDIIGLFLHEEIQSRHAFEVIEAIRRQGGLSILPHPFHHHKQVEDLAQSVDMIEVFNARIRPDRNEKAVALAAWAKKPAIVGSDAHFLNEIDNAIIYFDTSGPLTKDVILQTAQQWKVTYTSVFKTQCSQLVKGFKKRDPILLRRQLYTMLAENVIKLKNKFV